MFLQARALANQDRNVEVAADLSDLDLPLLVEPGHQIGTALVSMWAPWADMLGHTFAESQAKHQADSQAPGFMNQLRIPKQGSKTAGEVRAAAWVDKAFGKSLPGDQRPQMLLDSAVPWGLTLSRNSAVEGCKAIPGDGAGLWLHVRAGTLWALCTSMAHSKGRVADSFADSSRRHVNALSQAQELSHTLIPTGWWLWVPAGFTVFFT